MIQAVKSTILVVSNIAVTDSDWIIHPKVSGSTEISHNFLMSIPNEKKIELKCSFFIEQYRTEA